jgi:hypothetical protein
MEEQAPYRIRDRYMPAIENDPLVSTVPKPSEMTTNELTHTIIKYLRARGHYAVRINVIGVFDEKNDTWRRSATDRGTADIHACVNSRHISIEIKRRTDRQSTYQKLVQEQVEQSGGVYLIICAFSDFHNWYYQFT